MSDMHRVPPDLSGLSPWAPELAQTFVTLASDIALVLDDAGRVCSVAQAGHTALDPDPTQWQGKLWADTVLPSCRDKVLQTLQEVKRSGLARRREVNHHGPGGQCVAMAYTALRLGQSGPVLVVGRDLAAITAMQQRYLLARQQMEQGYWRARQAEARYRLLFQVATDAVLLVDTASRRILEANQAAADLFELPVEQLQGRDATFGFERESRTALEALLERTQTGTTPADARLQLLGKMAAANVTAIPFDGDTAPRLLLRVRRAELPGRASEINATLARLVDSSHDGVVVTDTAGAILVANPAFLQLIRVSTEMEVRGRPLQDWLGVGDAQFGAVLEQVRSRGVARRQTSRVLSADAQLSPVELSAAQLSNGEDDCIGFTIRPLPAAGPDAGLATELHAVLAELTSQLASQMGQAPLPDLLRQAALVLERQFIRLALERSADGVAGAARLLGISEAEFRARQ